MGEPTELSGLYLTLYEGAMSEAKRLDTGQAGLDHLAVLLAKREPDAFDEVFGVGSAEEIRTGRARVRPGASMSDLRDFLAGAERERSATDELAKLLEGQVEVERRPPAQARSASELAQPANGEDPDSGLDRSPVPPPKPFSRTSQYLEHVIPTGSAVGREREVDEVLSLVGRMVPRPALVSGPEGCGRSALIDAIAARVGAPGYEGPLAGATVVRVMADRVLLADESVVLRQVIEDATRLDGPVIVAVDDLEVILGFGARDRMNVGALMTLRAAVGAGRVPLVLVVDSNFAGRLAGYDDEFIREVSRVTLEPLGREVLEVIVAERSPAIAAAHRVQLGDDLARLALAPQGRHDTLSHPALAVGRLDGACARAALRADRTVAEADFDLASDPAIAPPDPASLAATLAERVMGQDDAVERLARHLSLTRAQLDLRPDRPDGVFLFVGPTGVGKTEMARAVSAALHDDESRMLRLDMSEYAGEWSISQLIGPPPGYVGSTDPENWLTTKVRAQPDCVLLLDEIEKAHPRVWNTFLQVFDAGHLTDAQGRTADFSRAVVILTSNLGAEAFAAPAVGFGRNGDAGVEVDRVVAQVKDTMAPELVNRLDDVIVFRPLSRLAIRAIAEKELDAVCTRLGERGYRLSYDPAVVDLLAERGYSPAYGARHLQRNIIRDFLQPLAGLPGRHLHASVADDVVEWISVETHQTSHVREVSSGDVVAVGPGDVLVVEGSVAETAVEDGDETVADDS